VIDDEVDARPRRERGQPRKQVQRLENEVARAVLPWALQLEHDAAVLAEPEPILRDRRPQQVSAELLAPLAILPADRHVRVKVEALDMGVPGPARGDPLGLGVAPQS
jgi:hypothetical protein